MFHLISASFFDASILNIERISFLFFSFLRQIADCRIWSSLHTLARRCSGKNGMQSSLKDFFPETRVTWMHRMPLGIQCTSSFFILYFWLMHRIQILRLSCGFSLWSWLSIEVITRSAKTAMPVFRPVFYGTASLHGFVFMPFSVPFRPVILPF